VRVHYHTFGCKANQYDSERMRQEAEARGAATTAARAEADVIVVNTCTVTNHADAEARRFIRRVRRERPGARIVVAGCSAALRTAEYRAMDGVSDVVPGHDPAAVAVAVAGASGAAPPVAVPARVAGTHASSPLAHIELRAPLDRMHTEPVGGELLRARRGAARGWLKIQDGCDRKCSFCATRLARGASRSRPPAEVVGEAALLARAHAELVITGIHIGHYGRDLEPAWTLSRLCAELLDRVPGVRIRIGSVEATEVDDLLLELLATSGGRLAPHLHMPLQSGADAVLRRMRRWHTRAQYRTRALEIAERVHPLGLGADVIAGFPGETPSDHEATRALVEELPFTYLHVFPYSPRSGTVAAGLEDAVPQRTAGERSRELRELAHDKGRAYRASRVGGAACVVVERRGGGLTEDYLRVDVRGAARQAPPDAAGESAAAGAWQAGAGRRSPVLSGTLLGDGDHLYIDWPSEPPRIEA